MLLDTAPVDEETLPEVLVLDTAPVEDDTCPVLLDTLPDEVEVELDT